MIKAGLAHAAVLSSVIVKCRLGQTPSRRSPALGRGVPRSESIDRDSKHQGEYAQDFSGILADFFSAAGAALAGARAAGLGPSSSSRRANMLPVIAMVACGRGADGGRLVPSLN